MPTLDDTSPISTVHSLAELRVLIEWASLDETRRAITQVVWTPDAAYATNGHRLIRMGLDRDPRRRFALSSVDLTRWVYGMTGIGQFDRHPERGSTAVELVLVGDLVQIRTLPAARPSGPVLSLPVETEPHPPFQDTIPVAVRHGIPKRTDRKVVPHALSARYLAGIEAVHRALYGKDDHRVAVELVDAPGALDPVVYALEIPHPVHDRGVPCAGRRWSAEGVVTMVIMPMRAGD